MNKVAIISIGYSEWQSPNDKNRFQYSELAFLASKKAMDEIGIEKDKIDVFIEAGIDWVNGRLISNMHTASAIGGYLKDESMAAENGLLGLIYACMKIKTGANIAIITASYGGDSDLIHTSTTVFDPFLLRPLGFTYLHGLALQAASYKLKYNIEEEYAAKIISKNRNNGLKNPTAYIKAKISEKEVLDSECVIWPLREKMISETIAGAVSVIIASEDVARRYTDSPVWIEGFSWITDNYYLGSKTLDSLDSLRFIANRLYNKLAIENPVKKIDSFELDDVTPYHEMMEYEALGLAEKGLGYRAIDEGMNTNLSGGTTCTNLFVFSSLYKLAEAYRQITKDKGYEKFNVERALVHGISYHAGASSQTNTIVILKA